MKLIITVFLLFLTAQISQYQYDQQRMADQIDTMADQMLFQQMDRMEVEAEQQRESDREYYENLTGDPEEEAPAD